MLAILMFAKKFFAEVKIPCSAKVDNTRKVSLRFSESEGILLNRYLACASKGRNSVQYRRLYATS